MGLDLVEFAMAIEDEFDLVLPDAEAAKMRTLGDVHAFVQTHFGRKTNDPADSWRRIVELAVVQFDVAAVELNPQSVLLELAPYG